MEKLKLKKFIFNKKGLIKGVLLGTALGLASCSMPSDPTMDPVPYEEPAPEKPNDNGNTTPTTDPTNPSNPGNENNEPTNPSNPGNENNEPTNPNNPDNGGNENNDPTPAINYGGNPYNTTIGNGNYNFHTFMGAETVFDAETVQTKVDHYLDEGKTYVNGLVTNLKNSMNGRTIPSKFNDLFSDIPNATFKLSNAGFEKTHNKIAMDCGDIIKDIVKNISGKSKKEAFEICYRVIANESYKAGLGSDTVHLGRYNSEKNEILDIAEDNNVLFNNNIDLTAGNYESNFVGITNLLDQYLTTAAANMGNGITANDLRQVINLALTSKSLESMYDRTKSQLKLTENGYSLDGNYIKNGIELAIDGLAMLRVKPDNGLELC